MNIKAVSIICVFAAFFVSCGAHRDIERRLDEADAMMGCAPDSALAMLETIRVDGMGGGQRARYALLLTKATDKCYKPIEDDSLISFAADYYSGHGDSLEVQSLFYLGYYNGEKRINDKALLHLSHAYDAAFAAGDKFYAAMSAREMSIVYRRLYMVDEGLKWARIAKNLFVEAGKPVHAAWVDNTIADALIYNGRYGDAKILLDSLEHSAYYEDFPFRRSTLINRVTLALQIDSFKEVLDIYDNLSINGYTFTSHARLNQAKAAIELGMLEEADNYMSMARQLRMSDVDSLYERKLLSRLYAARGNFREAYETASIFGNDVMNSDMRLISNPQTQLLTDNYKLNADIHRLQAEKKSAYIVGLTVVCLLLGVLIYIIWKYYKSRLANRMLEIEQLVSSSRILMEDLTLSNKRYNELTEENITLRDSIAGKESEIDRLKAASDLLNDGLAESESRYRKVSEENMELRNSIADKETGFEEEIRGVFGRHLNLLNDMCEIWYKYREIDSRQHIIKAGKGKKENEDAVDIKGLMLYKQIVSKLSKLTHIQDVEELARIIDKYDDNWMTRFKTEFPDLKEAEYRLAIYRYLGFRTNTIVALCNYKDSRSAYMAKFRLKEKLSKMAKNQDALAMIKKLE